MWYSSKFKDGDVEDPTYRQAIVDIFINSVFLYDDELTVTYNWKDGTKNVTPAELEATSENTAGGGIPNPNGFCGSYLDDNPPGLKQIHAHIM